MRAELLEVVATKAKTSAEKRQLTKASEDVYAEQPGVMANPANSPHKELGVVVTPAKKTSSDWDSRVMATRTHPPTKQLEVIVTPTTMLTQKESESFPDREVLLAKLQAKLAASTKNLSEGEPESFPDREVLSQTAFSRLREFKLHHLKLKIP